MKLGTYLLNSLCLSWSKNPYSIRIYTYCHHNWSVIVAMIVVYFRTIRIENKNHKHIYTFSLSRALYIVTISISENIFLIVHSITPLSIHYYHLSLLCNKCMIYWWDHFISSQQHFRCFLFLFYFSTVNSFLVERAIFGFFS